MTHYHHTIDFHPHEIRVKCYWEKKHGREFPTLDKLVELRIVGYWKIDGTSLLEAAITKWEEYKDDGWNTAADVKEINSKLDTLNCALVFLKKSMNEDDSDYFGWDNFETTVPSVARALARGLLLAK